MEIVKKNQQEFTRFDEKVDMKSNKITENLQDIIRKSL